MGALRRSIGPVSAALALLLCVAVPAHAQGVPGVERNACLAGKTKCVRSKLAGLLQCRRKCQKDPGKCGASQASCEARVQRRFDGGARPEKGCFAKLEAKQRPEKPQSVCTTTGDAAAVEAQVDAAAVDLLATLEGLPRGADAPAFGHVFLLADATNDLVDAGADVPFSDSGPLEGVLHTPGAPGVTVAQAGVYRVAFHCNVTAGTGAAPSLAVNGAFDPSTVVATPGSGHAAAQAILELAAGDVVTVRNGGALGMELPQAPFVGASLTIERLDQAN